MHSILRQQEAQFVAVGGCGCLLCYYFNNTMQSNKCKCFSACLHVSYLH